jgi:hypothetical protein
MELPYKVQIDVTHRKIKFEEPSKKRRRYNPSLEGNRSGSQNFALRS